METYTFLKGRQDNKWCSIKKFDFSNKTKKSGTEEVLSCHDVRAYKSLYRLIWSSEGKQVVYECNKSVLDIKKRVYLGLVMTDKTCFIVTVSHVLTKHIWITLTICYLL